MSIFSRHSRAMDFFKRIAPGVLLTFTVATAAQFLGEHYGAPVMLFALLLGMAFHFLSVEGSCVDGIQFTASRLLKIGVALLGVKVTDEQILSLGLEPLILIPLLVMLTILIGLLLSRACGRSNRFGLLTGGAVAICGASAALAIASTLPRSKELERDTLFTVVAVTLLSTVAMIFYPIIFDFFGFDDGQTGLLIGASIHDVAQVVGAGYVVSDHAGDVATYVKLLRVAMLPIVVIVIALSYRKSANAGASFPWFALGFAALLVLNSMGMIPPGLRAVLEEISRWFLVAAIAALGIKTSIKAMADLGARHLIVVVGETLFLLAVAIIAVQAMNP